MTATSRWRSREPPQALSARRVPGWRAVSVDRHAARDGSRPACGSTSAPRRRRWRPTGGRGRRRGGSRRGVLVNLGGDIAVAGPAPPGGWPVRVADDHRAPADAPGQIADDPLRRPRDLEHDGSALGPGAAITSSTRGPAGPPIALAHRERRGRQLRGRQHRQHRSDRARRRRPRVARGARPAGAARRSRRRGAHASPAGPQELVAGMIVAREPRTLGALVRDARRRRDDAGPADRQRGPRDRRGPRAGSRPGAPVRGRQRCTGRSRCSRVALLAVHVVTTLLDPFPPIGRSERGRPVPDQLPAAVAGARDAGLRPPGRAGPDEPRPPPPGLPRLARAALARLRLLAGGAAARARQRARTRRPPGCWCSRSAASAAVVVALASRLAAPDDAPGRPGRRGVPPRCSPRIALAVWLAQGPLAQGWARRAGTPAAVLAAFAPKAAAARRPSTRPADALRQAVRRASSTGTHPQRRRAPTAPPCVDLRCG